jgi:hypothetical protein
MKFFNWILENKKWIFSGIGVLIITILIKVLWPENSNNDIPEINIENSSNSIVQVNEQGDNIVNHPKEEYKPKMFYLIKETKVEKITKTGKIKSTLYFGSDKGFPLMNPLVHIFFDNTFESAGGGVTGQGMVSAGNLSRQVGETQKDFMIKTNLLNPGNYFIIEIESVSELKILNIEMNP